MHKHLNNGEWPNKTNWLSMLLVAGILFMNMPNSQRIHAANSYKVTLSTHNFGIQFLHVQADDLSNPLHATFSLTNGAALWYGIEVQSQPPGLRPVAADLLNDLVSSEFAQYGLLPPSGIIPINTNLTFFETVQLAASFSGPNQQIQLTLNPFDIPAATFDVCNLILQLLGEVSTNVQVGLLEPGHLQQINDEIKASEAFVTVINDFVSLLSAAVQHSTHLLGASNAFVIDLLKLFTNKANLARLVKILTLILGPAVPGIAATVASYASGLHSFLVVIKLTKFLADLALSLGSYLFQQGTFPTVLLQSVSPVVPTAAQTSTLSPTPLLTPTLIPTQMPTQIPTIVPTPTPSITITEFPVPTANSFPLDITAGPDGNLWFIEQYGNKIGRMTPHGVTSEFPIPTTNSSPAQITTGPDGNVWFTELNSNNIGRITPNGTITEFPIPTTTSYPTGITAGPDGNLWFTELNQNKLARITPNGTITEFPVPTANSFPYGITTGPDGNLWFTESEGDKIGRITPSGTIAEFPIPTAKSFPADITTGPDGDLWFSEENGNKIGRITPNGTITEFPIPTANSYPGGITTGPDGNLWFTEYNSGKIGRITPNGTIAEFPIPTTKSGPLGITKGPDGNLWFTERQGNKIGRIIIQ